MMNYDITEKIKIPIIFMVIFLVSSSAKTVNAANTYTEPLDFIADLSSRSGAGWSWDADTATFTLDD